MSDRTWEVFNHETGKVVSLWSTRREARQDAEKRNVYPPGTPGLLRVREQLPEAEGERPPLFVKGDSE